VHFVLLQGFLHIVNSNGAIGKKWRTFASSLQDDIGVSGVIGSAVFNITLVIAVCALSADRVFILNWWSVVRDCGCYLVSVIVLLATIANEQVSWYEALIFLLLYVAYCVFMAFSSRFEAVVKAKVPVPESWNVTQGHAAAGAAGTTVVGSEDPEKQASNGMESYGMTEIPLDQAGSEDAARTPSKPQPQSVEPPEDHLEKPMDGGMLKLVKFYVLYPLYFSAKYTIPGEEKNTTCM